MINASPDFLRRHFAMICAIIFAQFATSAVAVDDGPLSQNANPLNWEFAPDPTLPNVLILGDSISIGYTLRVRELLKGKANVHRPMRGEKPFNCGGTRKGVRGIDRWLAEKEWALIHFNWGLHDFKHLTELGKQELSNDANDPVEAELPVYRKNLEILTKKLKATGARFVFATTTPVVPGTLNPLRDPAAPSRYNEVATGVMQGNGVRMNDLFSFVEPHLEDWQLPKNVHFNSKGSAALGEQVASVIAEELALVVRAENDVPAEGGTAIREKKIGSYLETGGETKRDIVYKQVGRRALKLDLYYPTDQRVEASPVIIYTHGGGWAAGSRSGVVKGLFSPLFTQLLDKGFSVASVDYRLYNRGGSVRMRDCVIDSKDAVRYLAKNAKSLGIDSERFYVMGDSAGGQIAQMLLLTPNDSLMGDPDLSDVNYRILAGVSWYGPCDFENQQLFNHDDRPDFVDRFRPRIVRSGVSEDEALSLYREMSPVNYLEADSAPLLMIQGDRDTTIPVKHAYYMQKWAKQLGAPLEVVIVKNAGHNWRRAGGDIEPTKEEITTRTIDFFLSHRE